MTTEPDNKQLAALVERAQNNNYDAMEKIIKTFHPKIFTLVLMRVKNREDSLDLTQDIFLNVWKNIKHLKSSDKFRSWIFTIAYNKIKNFHRKKSLLSFLGLAKDYENINPINDSNTLPVSKKSFKEFCHKFEVLMTPMSIKEKEIFVMKYLDNLTIIEIATILNRSQSTVKTHLYRSLEKIKKNDIDLKKLLEKQDD